MQYVYILQSLTYPDRHYVGCTNDVAERIEQHNAGRAEYLKSGSGRAFAKKHF